MALDPQTKALLDEMAETEAPPPWEIPLADLRAAFNELSDALAIAGPEVRRVEDRSIPGPHGPIPIRLYWPKLAAGAASDPLPVFVHFHGGGFVLLGIDQYESLSQTICQGAQCIVVAVDYRKAPENRFPKPVDDCWTATQWAAEHAASFGGDAARIAVGGDSAGGCLAAVIAQQAKAAGGPKLAFQLLIYPVTDLRGETESYREFAEDHLLTREMMQWFTDSYLNDDAEKDDPRASPLRAADLSSLPAAYVLTAGYDPLRDEGAAYAEKLKAAGVPVTLRNYPNQIHAFWSFGGRIDEAATAHEEACAALRQAFGTSGV